MCENYKKKYFWRIRANFSFKLPKHFFYLWKSLQTFFDVCRKIVFDFFLALMYGVKLSKILYNFPEHIKKGLQRFSKIKKVFRKLKIKNSSRLRSHECNNTFEGDFQTLWYISVFFKSKSDFDVHVRLTSVLTWTAISRYSGWCLLLGCQTGRQNLLDLLFAKKALETWSALAINVPWGLISAKEEATKNEWIIKPRIIHNRTPMLLKVDISFPIYLVMIP